MTEFLLLSALCGLQLRGRLRAGGVLRADEDWNKLVPDLGVLMALGA